MPTVNVNANDLRKLVGRSLSLRELEYNLPLIKCEVKAREGGELNLEVNADRPDLFSAEGIARALKGFLGVKLGPATLEMMKGQLRVRVDPSVKGIRPYIVCAAVRGLRLTDRTIAQLMQLQDKLDEGLCRRRRKASIGMYDLDSVKPPFTYAALPPRDIGFTPLNEASPMEAEEILTSTPKGVEYGPILRGLPRYPLLFDSVGTVLSMPPIINSEDTRVSLDTRNIFIDITTLSEPIAHAALNILAYAFADRGARVESVSVHYPNRRVTTPQLTWRRLRLGLDDVNATAGLDLAAKDAVACLRRMRFDAKTSMTGILDVGIPPYRADILHPVDLIEDVIIGFGYDRLKPEMPQVFTVGRELEKSKLIRRLRDLMVASGFQEILTYMLTNPDDQTFKIGLSTAEDLVELVNPVSREYSVMRRRLLPGILDFLGANTHVDYPQRVFECGDVVKVDANSETGTSPQLTLSAAISDYRTSFENIQSAVYGLLAALKVKGWQIQPTASPMFIPGRTASIILDGYEAAVLGEVHPQVLNNFGIPNPTVACELNITTLLGA